MSRICLAFDYNGTHEKSHYGKIDACDHLRMLLAAIDHANPHGEYDVIVSAIAFDLWSLPHPDERMLAWQVYKRARIVTVYPQPQDHQHGACWCLRMATEAAAALGAQFLVHLADDVLLNQSPDKIVQALGDADYVGSNWESPDTLNTQVFACRVKAVADIAARRFVFDPVALNEICEHHLWLRLRAFGLKAHVKNDWGASGLYFHTHHVDAFREECLKRGIAWA